MRSEIMAEYSFKNYLLENYVMLIMLLGIYLLYFNSRKVIRVRSERIMPVIGAGILLSSILEYLDGYFSTFTDTMTERKLINALGYSIYPILIMLVIMSIIPRDKWIYASIPAMINTVYCIFMLFGTHYTVYFDEFNDFHRGALGYLPMVIDYIYLIVLFQVSWVYVQELKTVRRNLFLFITGSLIFTGILAMTGVVFAVNEVAAFCVILFLLYVMLARQANTERALLLADTSLYERQVSPHFIYNGLGMIRSMLPGDSEAKEVLDHFTRYLRGNAELMTETGLIPAVKENEILVNYIYMIEQRFEGSIIFEQDHQDLDFELPAFTVQILVENAVNHGIRKKESGKGKVRISSIRTKKSHVVEVEDDGVGFDVSILRELGVDNNPEKYMSGLKSQNNTEKRHLGLINLKTRLEVLCNGRLTLESTPGKGTLARVEIPVKQEGVQKLDFRRKL